jgi:uncharacterized membrane protein
MHDVVGYVLLGPAIWALLNHLDKYLLAHFFGENAAAPLLAVFTGFAGLLVATAISLFAPSVHVRALWQACLTMGAGALLVSSYMPYMIAMQRDEASIVASLYRLTPLFVFALSYVVLGESLRPRQIGGGLVTIAGSIALVIDLNKRRRYRLDICTFLLMCAACLMNAWTVVIFKFTALKASFWISAFWEYVGAALFWAVQSCDVPSYRRTLISLWLSRKPYVLVPPYGLG